MTDPALFWHNPTAVRIVALAAVGLLVTTIWLFRRQKRSGRGAAIVCLIVSVGLHIAIVAFVPKLSLFFAGTGDDAIEKVSGNDSVSVAVFTPDFDDSLSTASAIADQLASGWNDDETGSGASGEIAPLSLPEPIASLAVPVIDVAAATPEPIIDPGELIDIAAMEIHTSLASSQTPSPIDRVPTHATDLDDVLGDWLTETLQPPVAEPTPPDEPQPTASPTQDRQTGQSAPATQTAETAMASIDPIAVNPSPVRQGNAVQSHQAVPGGGAVVVDEDFTARLGNSKLIALKATGGDANTEAAVAAALKFLTETQRADGAWDPLATGAGRERAPLGLTRGSAGRRAETGITGLALLSLLGAGNTHQSGEYQENVYRGLAYLLGRQRPDGSLAGDASVYAAHYCHAMASLAIAEAAAMTGDAAALESTRRAIAYSRSTQHPTTGGWRYTRGDRGDLSQLGWQAMLIDAAVRSGAIDQPTSMQAGVARFLDSVKSGASGGLASYRPGEGPTATMTAEALATRLLIGQQVPIATIREAESVLLGDLPGGNQLNTSGLDNYYYWYYATLALHQLQDDAWDQWNNALKRRLLSTQRPDGSWPDTTLWGGYGGTVYSTSMATLCLETYYRHTHRAATR